jgi:hypothetical protein
MARDPFVTTFLQTSTGAGASDNVTAPGLSLDGRRTGTLTGGLAFVRLGLGYQQNLFGRSSLGLALGGSARSGTDEESVLSTGLSAVYGLDLVGKVRVFQGERVLVSALLQYSATSLYGIDLYKFAESVVENGLRGNNSALVEGSSGKFVGGGGVAYSPASWAGLTFVGSAGSSGTYDGGGSDFAYGLYGSGEVDFHEVSKVPLGILLYYSLDSLPIARTNSEEGISTFGFALAYTGRRDFSVSLDASTTSFSSASNTFSFDAEQILLNLQYFF